MDFDTAQAPPLPDSPSPETRSARPRSTPRPPAKQLLQLLRRGHLYFGLLLFPWAILYGVTAFLFNHPTAFSDQPTRQFGREALVGSPLEVLPSPQELAEQVVGKLNETKQPATPFVLAGPARFGGREFAFATVKGDGQTINLLIDVNSGGGTIRTTPLTEPMAAERAPFAIGSVRSGPDGHGKGERRGGGGRGGRGPGGGGGPAGGEGIRLANSLAERVRAAVPAILEFNDLPAGEVTVTSVPDVVFPVEADGRVWMATYQPLTGAVSGSPAEARPASEFNWRRFLLRLHKAHGYPGVADGRWFWAVIVDVMAFTLCFWGLSGLLMWWQIKATRTAGVVLLALSAVAATALGFAMHAALTG